MQDRRLVGIDLGITSAHTVRVLAGDGGLVCRRKAVPTVESLGEVEQAALAGAAAGTRLEVVVEPTGPAWLPIAVFFAARGHTVYRVSSAKAHDLRRFLRRHAKSNGIDADTLARLPLVDPAGLWPLQLPDAARAALDRRVRACDRLTRQAADHKRRIKGLVRQLLPASPLTGELGQADLAVLERWADPQALVAVGRARLQQVLASASAGQQGTQRAEQWLAAAHAALELYGDHSAIAFQALAAEVHSEVRLLRATQAELAAHAREREACYRRVDPAALARSLPGLADDRRARPGRHHGLGQPLRHRGQVPLLHRPGPTSIRDRPDRPQRPTHQQGRQPAAADHPVPRRRPRPPPRPPARPHLLDPDGRARQRPPGGGLCGRRPPGRARLDGHGPRHALRHLRHRRHPRHPRPGQADHRRTLDRARGGPPAAAPQEGEGPSTSPARTCAWRSRRNEATLPFLGHSWPTTQPRQADPAATLTAKPP